MGRPNQEESETDTTLTVKQEAFCHAYIENGGNASAAYREAYDADSMKMETVHVAACNLLSNPKVATRVKQLRDEAAYKHKISLADILNELEEARVAASTCETPQAAAMVSATLGKAKILGYDRAIPLRHEVTGKNGGPIQYSDVTDDELERRIAALQQG